MPPKKSLSSASGSAASNGRSAHRLRGRVWTGASRAPQAVGRAVKKTTTKDAAKNKPVASTWRKLKVKPKTGFEEEVCHKEPMVLRIRDSHGRSSSSSSSRRNSRRDSTRASEDKELTLKLRARSHREVMGYQATRPLRQLQPQTTEIFRNCRFPPSSIECEVRHVRPAGIPQDLAAERMSSLSASAQSPFRVPSNVQDALAKQPPHFIKYPLRPEQLRSLGWMISQERGEGGDFEATWRRFFVDPEKLTSADRQRLKGSNHLGRYGYRYDYDEFDDFYSDEDGYSSDEYGYGRYDNYATYGYARPFGAGRAMNLKRKRKDQLPFTVDLQVRAKFPVRGGILADKIGYGKTAATIGLIDEDLNRPVPPIPAWDKNAFLPAKGTLILVPGNLLEQWLGEISKFTGSGCSLKEQMKSGWASRESYDGAFKVFACTNVTPLKGVTVEELAQADIVICTYRLLFSPIYRERLKILAKRNESPLSNYSRFYRPYQHQQPTLPTAEQVTFDTKFENLHVRGGSLAMLREVTRRLIAGKAAVPSPSEKGTSTVKVRKPAQLRFPVLEMFYWRRVVFDEFHELEGFPADQQTSLQHLRAHYRWGLTGTPPLDSVSGSLFMSSLFRVDICGLDDHHIDSGDCPFLDSDKVLLESSARFLSLAARQNTAEIDHIPLHEHLIPIRHSARERTLYLAQARDTGVFTGGYEEDAEESQREAYERLLKLCSHFQTGSSSRGEVRNADEECRRIHDLKERRHVEARNRVSRGLKAVALLELLLEKLAAQPSDKSRLPWQKELSKAAAEVGKGQDEPSKEAVNYFKAEQTQVRRDAATADELCVELDGFRPQEQELKRLLGNPPAKEGMKRAWKSLTKFKLQKAVIERLLLGQAKEVASSLREVLQTATSFAFFKQTLQLFQESASGNTRTCTVCMQSDLPLSRLAITPCSHVFCLNCLRECVRRYKRCSLCNTQLANKDVAPLALEIAAAEKPSSARSSSSKFEEPPKKKPREESGKYGKYGTKLKALVEKLHEIRKEDGTAKVIVFAQFDDLKLKVADALKEFGVPMATLQGNPGQRDKVIREWQKDKTAAQFVLLLSLEQSASGTNLTAGNHVILVHPMLAATQEKAVSFEMQAIGRVRRHGQTRDVHVWRFMTLDTIEEEITKSHQAELFEREQGSAAASKKAIAASSKKKGKK